MQNNKTVLANVMNSQGNVFKIKLNHSWFKKLFYLLLLARNVSPSTDFDFDSESPWDFPLYKVENKLRFDRFIRKLSFFN